MAVNVGRARPRRLVLYALALSISSLSAHLTCAQPGNEGQVIHYMVNSLQARIAETSKNIKAKPRSARLYAERASLYVELYRALYEGGYKYYYGTKPPELSVAAITTKAIEDFSSAIKRGPSPELFYKRGEMYEARWAAAVKTAREGEWQELSRRRSPTDSWTLLTHPPDEKDEIEAFGRLAAKPDFGATAADYSEALRRNRDTWLANLIHGKLARLYLSRARALPLEFQSVKRIVNEPNPFGYSVWADFDKALEHFAESGPIKWGRPDWEWFWAHTMSRSKAYYEKAVLAAGYGKDVEALDALNMAEKYFDLDLHFLGYTECEIRGERSKLYVKLGQFDAAIADASKKSRRGMACREAYEALGDAHFAKGDWEDAIAAYTAYINDPSLYASDSARRNRLIAYINAGEVERAAKELSYCFNDNTSVTYIRRPEEYRLCAQLYRKLGKDDLALVAEKNAEEADKAAKLKAVEAYVLVELKLLEGISFDRRNVVMVEFIDEADPKRKIWTTVDDNGRFIQSYEKGRSFKIYVLYDGVVDGRPARFYANTEKITANGTVGPITIMLDHFVWKTQ